MLIMRMAQAIQKFEGWKVGYTVAGVKFGGTISWRNNNPGNLRYSAFQSGLRGGFSYFPTYEAGFQALVHQLLIISYGQSATYNREAVRLKKRDASELTVLEMFKLYAPSFDNNYPEDYARYVANSIGVHVDTPMYLLVK